MNNYILNKMKYKIALNLIIASCMLITIHATAQSRNTKELKSLILASFDHFPKMKEADNGILIATEKIKLVELNKQPDISADGSYSYIRPKIELPINGQKFQFAPLNNFNASFNGTYTLIDFGRIKAAIEQAKNELTYSQHNKENIQLQIAYQISNIYYYMVYLKKAIAIQDTILNTLDENKKIIESQYKNGTALEIDLLSILSNIDGEENKKTELSSMLRKQEILLEYASGISTTEGKEFDLNIIPTSANQNTELNPELIMLQDKLQQAKQDVSISQLKNKPVIGLRASMGTRNGYIPNISDMRFNYLGGVALSVPIYNGGKIKQQIKIQEKLADQQRLSLESMKQLLNKDIKQTASDINSAQDRLKRSSSQIQLAKSASILANNKLKHGTGTHLEVTSANTNLQRSLLNQLQLEFQVCTAQLEMARLSGIRFW
jgi:outer membrane protein TolC